MQRLIFPRFVLFALACFVLFVLEEILLSKFYHQLTYSEAQKYAPNYGAPSLYLPFELRKNFDSHMVSKDGDFDAVAHINSLGYRGKEFATEKNPGTTRIIFMGDSTTFGWGVNDDKTYPYLTEQLLKINNYSAVEVVNAGLNSGYDPDGHYLYYKKQGIKLRPDILIEGFFIWDDISDMSETEWTKVDSQGLPEAITHCCNYVDASSGNWRNKASDIKFRFPLIRESQLFLLGISSLEQKIPALQSTKEYKSKRELIGNTYVQYGDMQYEEEWAMAQKTIKATADLAASEGTDFIVLFIPYPQQINSGDIHRNHVQRRVADMLNTMGVKYIDPFDKFEKEQSRGSPSFGHDLHFNELGNTMLAESVTEYLLKTMHK